MVIKIFVAICEQNEVYGCYNKYMEIEKLPNYSERWQLVAEIEKQESLNETIEMRWNKLNYLFGMGNGMGVSKNRDGDEDIVRERWMILIKKAGLG